MGAFEYLSVLISIILALNPGRPSRLFNLDGHGKGRAMAVPNLGISWQDSAAINPSMSRIAMSL
jgi:hypothetical protein